MEECQKLLFQVTNVSKEKLYHLKIGCVLAPPHFGNRVAGPAYGLEGGMIAMIEHCPFVETPS